MPGGLARAELLPQEKRLIHAKFSLVFLKVCFFFFNIIIPYLFSCVLFSQKYAGTFVLFIVWMDWLMFKLLQGWPLEHPSMYSYLTLIREDMWVSTAGALISSVKKDNLNDINHYVSFCSFFGGRVGDCWIFGSF